MKNIYDIFEERKFDMFYYEHFSFNDLDELDMIFENIEKYIMDDTEILMEGFRDKIRDIKGNITNVVNDFIKVIKRLITDIIVKLNTKCEPVKKHIEKVGKENIIKQLEGRNVRMYEFNKISRLIDLSKTWFDTVIDGIDKNTTADGMKGINHMSSARIELKYKKIEGPLERQTIENLLEYVFNYEKLTTLFKSQIKRAESKFKSIISDNKDDKNTVKSLKSSMNMFKQGIYDCVNLINKALMTCAKLIANIDINNVTKKDEESENRWNKTMN